MHAQSPIQLKDIHNLCLLHWNLKIYGSLNRWYQLVETILDWDEELVIVEQVWGALSHILVDVVQTQTKCASGHVFYGLFCQSLPDRCFTDNKTLLLSTGQSTTIKSYIVSSGMLASAYLPIYCRQCCTILTYFAGNMDCK